MIDIWKKMARRSCVGQTPGLDVDKEGEEDKNAAYFG